MATAFEDLRILQDVEKIADEVWEVVGEWQPFARETIGSQLVRATDSIGANIAECYGRFHYGEKLNFLYYARGSLFETKYWLNRCKQRKLLAGEVVETYAARLSSLAQQLNNFASSLKQQRTGSPKGMATLKEAQETYIINPSDEEDSPFITSTMLDWLKSYTPFPPSQISNLQSQISET